MELSSTNVVPFREQFRQMRQTAAQEATGLSPVDVLPTGTANIPLM